MIIESLAWFGALLSCLLSVPQLVQALHSDRSGRGVRHHLPASSGQCRGVGRLGDPRRAVRSRSARPGQRPGGGVDLDSAAPNSSVNSAETAQSTFYRRTPCRRPRSSTMRWIQRLGRVNRE